MRCQFCFATFVDISEEVLPKGHLNQHDSGLLVDCLANAGFREINFAGGEPTLCPWLPDLIKRAANLGLVTSMVTNGTRITEQWLAKLENKLDYATVSIDSLDRETLMDSGRTTPSGPMDRANYLSAINLLQQSGIRTKINTVLTQGNLDQDLTGVHHHGKTRAMENPPGPARRRTERPDGRPAPRIQPGVRNLHSIGQHGRAARHQTDGREQRPYNRQLRHGGPGRPLLRQHRRQTHLQPSQSWRSAQKLHSRNSPSTTRSSSPETVSTTVRTPEMEIGRERPNRTLAPGTCGDESTSTGTAHEPIKLTPPTDSAPPYPDLTTPSRNSPQYTLLPRNAWPWGINPGPLVFPGKRRQRVTTTTTTTGITVDKRPPAAAGGDASVQLRHLRAHRAFQRQERHETARLDWATTISREESRRHITRHLQAKINFKDPRQGSRGKMDTPEGQDSMKRLARMIQGRHRLSPGDGHVLSWNLRNRMVQSSRSHLSDESAPTKEQRFPPGDQDRVE